MLSFLEEKPRRAVQMFRRKKTLQEEGDDDVDANAAFLGHSEIWTIPASSSRKEGSRKEET